MWKNPDKELAWVDSRWRCTIFNRSPKYYRWRSKGYVQSVCNAFFYFMFFYILHIQFAVSEKAWSNIFFSNSEALIGVVLRKKVFLEIWQNLRENTCASVSFLIKLQTSTCNFIKTSLAQVFSCKFCKISKNTVFAEHSGRLLLLIQKLASNFR